MKKTIKKILASVLVAAIVLTAAPLSGFAGLNFDWFSSFVKSFAASGETIESEHDFSDGVCKSCGYIEGLEYYIEDDERIIITSYEGEESELVIPAEICGLPVTGIDDYAFCGCSCLTSVTFPDSLTSIGIYAFDNCFGLTSIEIPDSVKSIGYCAFVSCYNLKNAILPDGITVISDGMFDGCDSLSSVYIPQSVVNINEYAFCDTALTDIFYSGTEEQCNAINIEAEENYDIADCRIHYGVLKKDVKSHLNEKVINASTCYSDGLASVSCDCGYTFERVIRSSGHKKGEVIQKVEPNCLERGYTLYKCSVCGETITDDYVNKTSHCKDSIVKIVNPTCIQSGYTVYHCNWCDNDFEDDYTDAVGHDYVNDICKRCGCIEGLEYCIENNESITITYYSGEKSELIIPDTICGLPVTRISEAFDECRSLKRITIPDSVVCIDCFAFFCCENLTEITLPDSITTIGNDAFGVCHNLKSIDLPDSLTSIGDLAFEACSSLTSIEIPDSVTSIGYAAFVGCTKLESIFLPKGITTISESMFDGCESLSSVVIPQGAVNIDEYAFDYCSELTDVFYSGTLEQWNKIDICEDGNSVLSDCRIHFGVSKEAVSSHFYEEIINGSACNCDGLVTVSCDCGYSFEKTIPASHDFSTSEITTEPDCTHTGIRTYYCSRCDATKEETVPALHHSFIDGICSLCGEVESNKISLNEFKKIEIDNPENEIMLEFTPTESGTYYFFSDSDSDTIGYIYDSEMNGIFFDDNGGSNNNFLIYYDFEEGETYYLKGCFYDTEKTGSFYVGLTDEYTSCHNFETFSKEATCISEGGLGHKCTRCGYSYFDEITQEALGHNYIDGVCELCHWPEYIAYSVDGGKVSVTGLNYDVDNLTIPSELCGMPVTEIDEAAFSGCRTLKSITIPDSVNSIGQYAFFDCNKIENITVDPNNKTYNSRNNCNAIIETDSDKLIFGCNNTAVPCGVKIIGEYAFLNCKINSVFLPESIQAVEKFAFLNCDNLSSVFFAGSEDYWNEIDFGIECFGPQDIYMHFNITAEQIDSHLRKNVVSEPSCEDDGEVEITCDCGYSYIEYIPAIGHNAAAVETVEPTCTENGYTLYHCSRCGATYSDDYVDASGHNFKNNICTRCGMAIAEIGLNEIEKVNGGESVVYRFTPTESGTYYFFSDSRYLRNIEAELYDSDMIQLDNSWRSGYYEDGEWHDIDDGNFVLPYYLEGGNSYYLEVKGYAGNYDDFYVCVTDSFTSIHNNLINKETVSPTCLDCGYDIFYCAICGKMIRQNYVQPIGHSFENDVCVNCGLYSVDAVESDNPVYGTKTYTIYKPGASRIRITFSNDTKLYGDGFWGRLTVSDSVGDWSKTFNYDIDEIGGKSVTVEGDTVKIIVTDAYFAISDVVTYYNDCDEHINTEVIDQKESTCYEDGYTGDIYCADCGMLLEYGEWISAHYNTKEIVEIVEPTCCSGYTKYRCTECGEVFFGDYTFPLYDHTKGELIETVEPSCYEDGYSRYTCSKCGEEFWDDWVLGHHEKGELIETVPPTCYEDGYSRYICSECGEEFVDWISGGHTKGELIETVPPTCFEDGYSRYICSVCGEEFCDDWVWSNYGHTKGELIETVPPTCTEDGYSRYICSVCGEEFCDDWIWTWHTKGELIKTVPPTCTEGGYSRYICSVCGEEFNDDFLDPLGHDFDDNVCSRCGLIAERINLNELKSGELGLEAEKYYAFTPTEDGLYYFYLHANDESIRILIYDSEMNYLNESYRDADCECTADETYYVQLYNFSDRAHDFHFEVSDVYENGGHDVQFIRTVEPTCDARGYDLYSECSECGQVYKTNYVEPLGHVIKNGVCTRCGMEIPEINLGDTKTVTVNEGGQIYYKFVPETSGTYYFYSVSSKDTFGYLYNADMEELDCDDDGGYGFGFKIVFFFEAGETYYLSARLYFSDKSGEISVCIADSMAELRAAADTNIVIDADNKYIYGLNTGIRNYMIEGNYINCRDSNMYLEVLTPTEIVGTGSVLQVWGYEEAALKDSYTFIIFGDVNGDGWYDGTDAMTVKLLANGMLTRDDVDEAVYMAADCNHDGVIDDADVDLLEQAGVLLASIDQTKSEEELLETSAYVEYLNLIDQTNEAQTTEVIEDEPVDPGYTFNVFDMLFNFIKIIMTVIKSVIAIFK